MSETTPKKNIEAGIANGTYRTNDITLVRKNDGRIVAHLPIKDRQGIIVQSSIINIVNNTIYLADLSYILDFMKKTKLDATHTDLIKTFELVNDELQSYIEYGTGLEKLYENSRKACVEFKLVLEKDFVNLKEKIGIGLEDTYGNQSNQYYDYNNTFKAIDLYLCLLIIRILSTYELFGEKVASEETLNSQINELNNGIQNIYERVLCPDRVNGINDSVYSYYFLKNSMEIEKIEKFLEFDSRYATILDYLKVFSTQCVHDPNYRDVISFNQDIYFDFRLIHTRINFAEKLYEILSQIKYLKYFLKNIKDLDRDTVNLKCVANNSNTSISTFQLLFNEFYKKPPCPELE